MEIKIRYNTDKDKLSQNLLAWRVLENGVEKFANSVEIRTSSRTTFDKLSDGREKWHISCVGKTVWDESGLNCEIFSLD